MTTKSALFGIGWAAGMAAICIAMLACMLAHIIKNRLTIGRWWV